MVKGLSSVVERLPSMLEVLGLKPIPWKKANTGTRRDLAAGLQAFLPDLSQGRGAVLSLASLLLPSQGGDPTDTPWGRDDRRRSGRDTFLSRDQVETPSPKRKPGAPHWGLSLRRGGIPGRGRGAAGKAGPAPIPLMNMMNMNEATGGGSARGPRPCWLCPHRGSRAAEGVASLGCLTPPAVPEGGLLPAGRAQEVTSRVCSTAWRGEELAAAGRCGGALSRCPSSHQVSRVRLAGEALAFLHSGTVLKKYNSSVFLGIASSCNETPNKVEPVGCLMSARRYKRERIAKKVT